MTPKTLFITLAVFIALASAQDCNNPLLDVFGISGLAQPQPGTDLTVCPNLITDQTCCSNATLTTLQADLTATTNNLDQLAAQRDLYLANLFSNITTDYQDLANQLQALDSSITAIQNSNPAIGAPLRIQANLFQTISNNLVSDGTTFANNFAQYQQARTICWTTLLQIQTSAWCLACDPDYASLGVQPDGTVNAGPNVCSAIQVACAPYLFQSLQFNALIQAQQTFARLNDTVTWLNAYVANNNQIPQDQSIDAPVSSSTNATERTVTLPQGCTNVSCPWQCDNLFSNSFELNQNIAANGAGIIGGADVVSLTVIGIVIVPVEESPITEETTAEEALLEETVLPPVVGAGSNVEEPLTEVAETTLEELTQETTGGTLRMLDEDWDSRFLQTGAWTPALNDTGFNITVAEDPANVNNNGEITTNGNDAPIKTVIGAILVILASWLIQ